MRRLALLAVPLSALALAGSVGAGSYVPPPGDCCPQWSPHGTQIVFSTSRSTEAAVGVVAATGGPDRFIPGIPAGTRSPDWTYVAYDESGALAVSKVDGSDKHVLGQIQTPFAWSPDSKRIAFVGGDGSLRVAMPDGTGQATVAPPPVATPDWSPDATRIAYVTKDGLHVVDADGGNDAKVAAGAVRDPRWSRDGKSLSFLRGANLVVRSGAATRSYPVGKGAVNNAWLPAGNALLYVDAGGQLNRLDLRGGTHRILATGGQFTLSPSGTTVAFAAGAECRDRVGVYVVRTDGSGRRRLTNSCTIRGTTGPDVLHGSFSQVVLGLGGDDTLYADDTGYFFDGNTLVGGPGNDRLVGGFGQDTLLGGPGDDVITGGASRDVIDGGPGRDRIDAGGGGDVIEARDGQRDVIDCGKNGYGKAGRDVVYADRVDVVASDCEIVHRS